MHCNLEPSHFYFDGSIYDKSLNPVFWYAERIGDEIILSEIKCKVKCKMFTNTATHLELVVTCVGYDLVALLI